MEYYRVMLVDDEIWALKGLEKIVDWKAFGFEIVGECRDGQEALEQARVLKPDLIFTDLMMDNMCGKDFLRHLRGEGNQTEVVFASAHSDFESAREGIRLGITDYILKPYRKEEIQRILTEAAQRLKEQRPQMTCIHLDRWGQLAEEESLFADETLKGGRRYIYLKSETISDEEYDRRVKMYSRFAKEEVVPLLHKGCIRGIIFASEENLINSIPPEIRIGCSFAGDTAAEYGNQLFEAAFSWKLGKAYEQDDAVRAMQKYILRNIDRNLTLEEIAGSAFLSKNYASSSFGKQVGISMNEFQKKARILGSLNALEDTNLSMSEVAFRSGYEDSCYFTKVFKAEMGMMPKEYRKQGIQHTF